MISRSLARLLPQKMEQLCTKVMLVSGNVGSIFEDPERMLKLWLDEFLKTVKLLSPGMIALHMQEVGGKNYEVSMQHVNQFVKSLFASEALIRYDRARVFLDEDFTASDKFTALGNIYFIHETVEKAELWNFHEFCFVPVEGKEVLSGNIENVGTKEKAKFPQHFFPEFKWSRKGFLRTRWNINNSVFDLVNIHLFHDASNIMAMQSSPSLYSCNRQQAFSHALSRFEADKYEKVPMFIFGDFNFRLDSKLLVQALTKKAITQQMKGKKEQVCKIDYKDAVDNNKVVLTIEIKLFDYYEKHAELFSNPQKWLHQFDREVLLFKDRLTEFEINFPPSYPFSEDVNDGVSYMKTRCPSWCDRVMFTHSAKDLIQQTYGQLKYDVIGKNTCMGDHKPVYLCFQLLRGQGNIDVVRTPHPYYTINYEIMKDIDLKFIDIHDYATFENWSALPENGLAALRYHPDTLPSSIPPIQSTSDAADLDSDVIDASTSDEKFKVMPEKPGFVKQRSFQDLAQHMLSVKSVLLRWPSRSESRHHSSSSEDFQDDNEDAVNADDNTDETGDDDDPFVAPDAEEAINLSADGKAPCV